jgi:hypothetical protein
VDVTRVEVARELLVGSDWLERTEAFAAAMRTSTRRSDGLLLVGTPEHEPWHLAAHLDDEAEFGGAVDLRPTLIRWRPPRDAPPHLGIGLDRLQNIRRGEPLLVVSPARAPERLLDRLAWVRRRGGTLFTLSATDSDLLGLAHESLQVGAAAPNSVDLDLAEHLVSLSAATQPAHFAGWRGSLRRALDRLSGP